ncbi:MAG: M23 family metallopeptidase, partial [Rhodomicrobium sp.]|nr:M23 family metallopeptidase [Rhodomicrobium sp.]
YLTKDVTQLTRRKLVFAERCARCHSSKLPTLAVGLDPHGCAGRGYLDCWNKYWNLTKTEEFKQEMKKIVLKDDFLENNALSTDLRIPVTLLETNACSPLATNAIRDNIWDNFSSESYKELPSVGTITVHHPITGEPRSYEMPAGGVGYTRVPSLVSLWSTAPFLLNNSVGTFNPSPSVNARMQSFQNSIEQMLWPEKRDKDPILGDKVPGIIDRTTVRSYVRIPKGYLPDFLQNVVELEEKILPSVQVLPEIFKESGVEIGPIPKGTPVKAAENGVVAYAGNELAGFGNLILVRHADGYVTAYAHNDELMVKRCEVVKRGQIIAKAGATGKVSKPQLHFEVRKDSKPVDPEGYFSRS